MKKVLISGSNGMLGIDLCAVLKGSHEVIGMDIKSSPDKKTRLDNFISQDITDEGALDKGILRIRPDIIIHTAAWTDVDGCQTDQDKAREINSLGTKNIARAALKVDAPLFYISTDFVFDGQKDTPYKEEDGPNPINFYGESKLEGEKFVQSLLSKFFIVRTSWLYGKFGINFVDTILNKAKTQGELSVVNDQAGSPTYTRDLASAIKIMIDIFFSRKDSEAGGIYGLYHISNGQSCSWFEFAKAILKIRDINKVKVLPITSDLLNRPAKRPRMSVLDNSKYERLTKKLLRPWREALAEYLS